MNGLDLYTPSLGSVANPDGSYPKDACRRVNQEWLNEQLKTKSEHVFVFTHEPAFKVQHNDCMHGDMSYGSDFSEYRNEFWKSIRASGARTYFCGHDHGYAHARIDDGDGDFGNDIHQFVVGTAGAGIGRGRATARKGRLGIGNPSDISSTGGIAGVSAVELRVLCRPHGQKHQRPFRRWANYGRFGSRR